MKRILLLCIGLIACFSCKSEYQPRNIESISIQKIVRDSTSIRSVVAINENELVYAGSQGDIGLTMDGGENWKTEKIRHQDSIKPHFRSMAKTKSSVFALAIANPALLYELQNGTTKLVYTEEHPKVFYDAMAFFDDKNGIAVGDPTEKCASIITTNDGGKTWQKIDCSQLPELAEGEAFFAASNTNIAIVKNTAWIVTGGTRARVLKTTDLGKTWSIYETPFIQGDGPQGMYSVDFYDENNGIAVGGSFSKPNENKANKAITTDGGKTWQLVADNQNPNYKSCVQYVPNTQGKEVFAVGFTGISYSKDGGHTWTEVSKEGYYGIQFVNKNTAWLYGSRKIGKLKLQD